MVARSRTCDRPSGEAVPLRATTIGEVAAVAAVPERVTSIDGNAEHVPQPPEKLPLDRESGRVYPVSRQRQEEPHLRCDGREIGQSLSRMTSGDR